MIARLAVAILLLSPTSAVKRQFHDLSFLGRGYNVLTGNPGSASDYGVESAIFKIKYRDDDKNSLPIGVDATRTPSCDMAFKSHRIVDMKTYTDELKFSVSTKIGHIQAPFSANAEYTNLAEIMTNHSSVFVETVADCEQYSARLNVFDDMAALTKNFRNAVATLPSVYDSHDPDCVKAFNAFFHEFGTHVVVQVSMGAKLVLRHEMSELSFRDLQGKGVNIDTAASTFSLLQVDPDLATAESPSEFQKQDAQLFGDRRTTTIVISKGAKVPYDANLDQWLQDSSSDPALLRFQLEPMHYFLPRHVREAVQDATKTHCKYVSRARCESIFPIVKKLDPLCPTVHYFSKWESRHRCFKGDKPAPPAPVAEKACADSNVMAGIRFSHRRVPVKKSFTGLADIGCTNIVDSSTKLFAPQWTEPVQKRKEMIECPRGQIASGIRLSHKCNANSLEKEFLSLQCARVSSTIRECQLTEWDSPRTLPAWSETSCPLGKVLKGIEFQYVQDKEQYRLRCCEVGLERCTDATDHAY